MPVGYVAEMNLSYISGETMWKKREKLEGRTRHKLASLRPKFLQDRFGFYAHSPSKLSIEPGYSFRRLAKVLILDVHSQFLQQQFRETPERVTRFYREFTRSEEHTSQLQSHFKLAIRL